MSSSEDEDLLPRSVSGYHFVNEREEPVCFSCLPFVSEGQSLPTCEKQVFLLGDVDDGLQKIYKQVCAWKLELNGFHPEICVLSKKGKWIKLFKARKSYEPIVRKILVTIHCLHFIKRNPTTFEKSLWDHVGKHFSHWEVRASQSDLMDHISFIHEMARKDKALANSELLEKLLNLKVPKKINAISKPQINSKPINFINDNEDDMDDEEADCFDAVCAICDDGGDILCCDGKCLRSFHASPGDGDGSFCRTLGYTRAEIRLIQIFLCLNCRFNMHQCFCCGKLGASGNSSIVEVLPCAAAACGRFYHPRCVANLLHPKNKSEATIEESNILAGKKFVCPIHKCIVCKERENKNCIDLQFAICRRCPKSYHRKCLPREICFEDEEGMTQRAWENLIPNRVLIYCLEHEIDETLRTPVRNHILFPEDPARKRVQGFDSSNKVTTSLKRKFEGSSVERFATGAQKSQRGSLSIISNSSKKNVDSSQSRKVKDLEIRRKPTISSKVEELVIGVDGEKPLREKLVLARTWSESKVAQNLLPSRNQTALPHVDENTEKRVLALVKRSLSSEVALEDFINTKLVPSTHCYSARQVDKTITLGKVEGSIEAVQTALQKIKEDGGSTENAKDVCGPEIVSQIMKWRNKLKVYLSPFLYGSLYTSFGRHFTKVDILKEIVDRLHWYVRNGDMIVDFCCGANDFSILMKEKLDAVGKNCSYRNYDVISPKNDFNFVKRDWMKVQPAELPNGSQLIMGLNPPFGVNGALASKFIDKALEFKPKLIILIVPKETQRLDEKRGTKYDLIWEDEKKLAGKAFYLPGNTDANDKQLDQWNNQPPPLFLWSRPDWTSNHIQIASKRGHKVKHSSSEKAIKSGGGLKDVDEHAEKNNGACRKVVEMGSHPLSENHCSVPVGITSSKETDGLLNSGTQPNVNSNRNTDSKWELGSKNVLHGDNIMSKVNSQSSEGKKTGKVRTPPNAREVDESSDMSISPPREGPIQDVGHSSPGTLGLLSEKEAGGDTLNLSELDFCDNFENFCSAPREEPRTASNHHHTVANNADSVSYSMPAPQELGYSIPAPQELGYEYKRDSCRDVYGGRSSGVDGRLSLPEIRSHVQAFGQQDGLGDRLVGHDMHSRTSNVDRRLSALELHSDVQVHGQQNDLYNRLSGYDNPRAQMLNQEDLSDFSHTRYAFVTQNPGLTHVGSLQPSSYGLSAMERYAPRLDELNHGFPTHSPLPSPALGSSSKDRYAQINATRHGLASTTKEFSSRQTDTNDVNYAGFAHGPFQPHGASGWLDN